MFIERIFLQLPIKVGTGKLLGKQRKFRVIECYNIVPDGLHFIGLCANIYRAAQRDVVGPGAIEFLHGHFTTLGIPIGNSGDQNVMAAAQAICVVFQPVDRKAAHLHPANPRDRAGGQGQPQLRRNGLGILSINFIEVACLKQHHMVRVSLFDSVVLHGGRLLAHRHGLVSKFSFIRCHGLRRKVAILPH